MEPPKVGTYEGNPPTVASSHLWKLALAPWWNLGKWITQMNGFPYPRRHFRTFFEKDFVRTDCSYLWCQFVASKVPKNGCVSSLPTSIFSLLSAHELGQLGILTRQVEIDSREGQQPLGFIRFIYTPVSRWNRKKLCLHKWVQIVSRKGHILHHLECIKPCKQWDKLPT